MRPRIKFNSGKPFELAADGKIELTKETKALFGKLPALKSEIKDCKDRYHADINYTASKRCAMAARELKRYVSDDNPDPEALFFRSCAISSNNDPHYCKDLGSYYYDRHNFRMALLAFTTNECDSVFCAYGEEKVYRQLNAVAHLKRARKSCATPTMIATPASIW